MKATRSQALRAVIRDADLKESFFTTPVALRAASSAEPPANKWPRLNNTGSFSGKSNSQGFKGKGKGKGGKSKGKDSRLAGLQMGVICASHTMVAAAMASATECISAELRDATVIILQCNARTRPVLPIDGVGVLTNPAWRHTLNTHLHRR